eukprot:3198738-Rhodomonas_salina.1
MPYVMRDARIGLICRMQCAYRTDMPYAMRDWDSEDIDYIYVLDAALAINPSAVSRLWVVSPRP